MRSGHPFMQLLELAALSLGGVLVLGVVTYALNGAPWLGGYGGEALNLLASQVLVFALPLLLVGWMHHRGEQRDFFRFRFGGRYWKMGLYGVLVALLLVPLNDWLTVWNDGLHFPDSLSRFEDLLRRTGEQSQSMLLSFLGGTPLPLTLLCAAVAPAVCEELFFRAGVQTLVRRWLGSRHAAVWITAAVFSLAHFEVFAFLPRFLLGALLGYVYEYGGSIVVNALVHFVNNALVVVAYHFYVRGCSGLDPVEPLGLDWTLTLCCTVAAVALFVVLFLLPGRDKESVKGGR